MDETRRKNTPELLAEQFQFTIEMSQEAVFWLMHNGQFSYVNEQACRSLGYTREELLSLFLWDVDPDFPKERWKNHWEELKTSERRTFETRHRQKDGHSFPVEVSACQITFDGNEFHTAFVRDITDRKTLEVQVRQAQKMEAVGQLAGGIAHDFNNLLSLILGRADLGMRKLEPTDLAYKALREIHDAATRSATLTKQLLGFARKQTIAPKVIDLNSAVEKALLLLQGPIGENINIAWLPGPSLWLTKIDPFQIDQIITNLAINARDAISDVGKLTIETAKVTFDRGYCDQHAGFLPGDFDMLAISDDGCGMDEETIEKIFEPFFTTKTTGEGTGLGLATVYGIIKQNRGFINVYSELGQGTTFRIYFPRYFGEEEKFSIEKPINLINGHGKKILLVEDDLSLLQLGEEMLKVLGYDVISTNSPSDAIQLAEKQAGTIDLLLTDVVMPEINGKHLAKQLQCCFPDLKVLFVSGYTANVIAHQGVLEEGVNFLQKPLSINDLSSKLTEILGER